MRTWTGRALGAIAGSLLVAGAVVAQETGTVTGQVTRAGTGAPVVGAQVFIVGTQLGALTNEGGRFQIAEVPAGRQAVRVQSMGYAADDQVVAVTAGEPVTVNIQMREQAIEIAPLVVTALGIERQERSLGYAVQTVTSQALARSPEVKVANALAGQSAGVQVVSASGRPGASARIAIRGESSFTGGGQPLFVIDGVPVSTDLDASVTGTGALEFGQAGNRGMDIDPNNIEEISLLRGAAATALYGSRAAHGVVVIRTKQGTPGSPMRISVSSRVSFDRPILGGYVTDWAAGQDGYFCNGRLADQGGWCQPGYPSENPNPATTQNWGPHKDSIPQSVLDEVGPVRFGDVREDFYRTARGVENAIQATGSLPVGGYTFGLTYLNSESIVQAGGLKRLNLNANLGLNLSSVLRSNTTVMYTNTADDWQNEGYQGLNRQLINRPPSNDIRQAWHADGTPVMWAANSPHPAWLARNEFNTSKVNRWIASQFFDVRIVPGLNLSNRIGLDTYLDERHAYQNERPWRTQAEQTSGGTDQRKSTRTQLNDDLVLSLERVQFGEAVTVSALVGGNVNIRERSYLRARGSDINIPDFDNIANFGDQRVDADLPIKQRLVGVYSQATVDYSDWAFLTLTGRNDWSSTLPRENNSYFYPSASLGVVFTDALGWHGSLLQYGKLRLSIAKVGSDAPPYRLSTNYVSSSAVGASNGIQQNNGPSLQFPYGDQVAFVQSASLGNPDLKPESTVEKEVGLELRLLDGRARLDMSYYDKSSYDQIFNVPASASSGFTQITRNAGDLRNHGIEVSLQTKPVRTDNLDWDVRLNWSRNRSEVLRLAPGVTSIALAGYAWPQVRIMEGEEYGVIWGYGWRRNEQGQMLIGDDGFPILSSDLGVIGATQPDWLGNASTTINYRGVGLSGLLDIRQGGQILNFETQYTVNSGRSILTETRGTPYTFEGVNVNTGQPNTVEVMRDAAFFGQVYGFDRHEGQVEEASYVKLREVTLSYDVPRRLLGRLDVQSMSLYVTGRNLKVWSPFSAGDPEGDNYGGDNAGGQYFRFFPLPQTRSWVMGVRASF